MRARFINEVKKEGETKVARKDKVLSILFTDIVGSSEKWKKHSSDMISALENLSKRVSNLSKGLNGTIIKTIGDAYMIAFDNLSDAVELGLCLQADLKDKPIKVGKSKLEIRIGICEGEVFESKTKVQGNLIIDYLGNTVNTASRIESEACEPGNVAFGSLDNNNKEIEQILEGTEYETTSFNKSWDGKIRRSGRLVTDAQRWGRGNLKGVKPIDVYHILN